MLEESQQSLKRDVVVTSLSVEMMDAVTKIFLIFQILSGDPVLEGKRRRDSRLVRIGVAPLPVIRPSPKQPHVRKQCSPLKFPASCLAKAVVEDVQASLDERLIAA